MTPDNRVGLRRFAPNPTYAYLSMTMGLIPVDSGKFAAARAASARLENGPPYSQVDTVIPVKRRAGPDQIFFPT